MLLQGAQHLLAAWYPSLSQAPAPPDDPFPAFQAFCREHRAAIIPLLQTRRVQTNEVRRCVCLLPAFGLVAQAEGDKPLALVEVGTSAGFNLLWDRYGYRYGTGLHYGDSQSLVQLRCELRSPQPPIPVPFPRVASRIGIDLNPVDVRDPDAALWLRALIWPGHLDRAELLQHAIAVTQHEPPQLARGDALELLPGILAALPKDVTVCVFHSFTLNQFPPVARDQFHALITAHSVDRNIWEIALEGARADYAQLELVRYARSSTTRQPLARCNPHGAWIEWLTTPSLNP